VIAGLEDATSGEIRIGGEVVNLTPPAKRGIAMVFQSYALYPHLTCAGNMALALKQEGQSKVIEERITEATGCSTSKPISTAAPRNSPAASASASPSAAPSCASRGCSCSTSRSRTWMRHLRMNTRHRDREPAPQLKGSMIYVTHDQTEAMTLADKIVVLRDGRVEQIGSADGAVQQPANRSSPAFWARPR
jgi:multiple sugar transport system ATP-binding protein